MIRLSLLLEPHRYSRRHFFFLIKIVNGEILHFSRAVQQVFCFPHRKISFIRYVFYTAPFISAALSLTEFIMNSCVLLMLPVPFPHVSQSLSDEDSFKKMSSTKEVLEKVEELLSSLVER